MISLSEIYDNTKATDLLRRNTRSSSLYADYREDNFTNKVSNFHILIDYNAVRFIGGHGYVLETSNVYNLFANNWFYKELMSR